MNIHEVEGGWGEGGKLVIIGKGWRNDARRSSDSGTREGDAVTSESQESMEINIHEVYGVEEEG